MAPSDHQHQLSRSSPLPSGLQAVGPLAEGDRVAGAVGDAGDRRRVAEVEHPQRVGGDRVPERVALGRVRIVDRDHGGLGAPRPGARGVVAEADGDRPADGGGVDEGPADPAVARAPEHREAGAQDGRVPDVVRRVPEVVGVEQRRLLELREHRDEDALPRAPPEGREGGERVAHREGPVLVVVVHGGQRDLLEVVRALGASGGLAGRLDGGQQQRDQDRDDRDHHQKLDQREADGSGFRSVRSHGGSSSWKWVVGVGSGGE